MQNLHESADELAQPLRRRLKNSGIIHADRDRVRGAVLLVNGELSLGENGVRLEAEAKCSIMVTDSWRTKPPKVRCLSRWSQELQRMKHRTEWHFNADGTLCYVLDAEWADTLLGPGQTAVDEIADIASFFFTRNLRYLLSRQLVAYRNGLARWPAEWEQWPHGLLGRQAYQNQKDRSPASIKHGKRAACCSLLLLCPASQWFHVCTLGSNSDLIQRLRIS